LRLADEILVKLAANSINWPLSSASRMALGEIDKGGGQFFEGRSLKR
jgi:hypothetical protein